MIARTWSGRVPLPQASAFQQHLFHTGVRDYRSQSGCLGVQVFRRDDMDCSQFLLVSWWRDLAALTDFAEAAGVAHGQAVRYPDDEAFGLVSDPAVIHYDVVADETFVGDRIRPSSKAGESSRLVYFRLW